MGEQPGDRHRRQPVGGKRPACAGIRAFEEALFCIKSAARAGVEVGGVLRVNEHGLDVQIAQAVCGQSPGGSAVGALINAAGIKSRVERRRRDGINSQRLNGSARQTCDVVPVGFAVDRLVEIAAAGNVERLGIQRVNRHDAGDGVAVRAAGHRGRNQTRAAHPSPGLAAVRAFVSARITRAETSENIDDQWI